MQKPRLPFLVPVALVRNPLPPARNGSQGVYVVAGPDLVQIGGQYFYPASSSWARPSLAHTSSGEREEQRLLQWMDHQLITARYTVNPKFACLEELEEAGHYSVGKQALESRVW